MGYIIPANVPENKHAVVTARKEGFNMINMNNLENMSIQELEQLKSEIENIIRSKKSAQAQEFTFAFDATNDPRKGKPYVARLYWADGKLPIRDLSAHTEIHSKKPGVYLRLAS